MARTRWHAATRSTVFAACMLLAVACTGTRQPREAAAGAASAVATSATVPRDSRPTSTRERATPGVADDLRTNDVTAPGEVAGADGGQPRDSTATDDARDGDGVRVPNANAVGDRSIEPGLHPIVDQAVNDLATRLGVAPDRVTVVLAQRVTWPDQRLGCPLRGGDDRLGGPQQGTRVHLRVHDLLYRYHTGGRRVDPFLCDPEAVKAEEERQRIEP